MEINRQILFPFLLFDKEIPYNEHITLYPVKMKDVLLFQQCQPAFTLRKDSIFREKDLIKMDYLTFIKHAYRNDALALKYGMPLLPVYYDMLLSLLQVVCGEEAEISFHQTTLDFSINGEPITSQSFDEIRKIILLQNDIDFDTDEFINIDTIKALEKARRFEAKKQKESADIEDYIDSLITELKVPAAFISDLSVRKFWRYIKRINRHEEYQTCRLAQMTGMVTFKEPLQHWMSSIEAGDKYESIKTDEDNLRSKIG